MEPGVMQRQAAFSILSGMLFAVGWWMFIDGYAPAVCGNSGSDCSATTSTAGYAWLPLVGATLVFVMINGMKWSELNDEVTGDSATAVKARIFLIFTLLIAIACMAGAGFIMADKFLRVDGMYNWSGVSCFAGTMTILAAAFLMRFLTLPPPGGY